MAEIPTKSIVCLALVKPGSRLAREWKLSKPSYGIYERRGEFGTSELRWGDGSWQELSKEDHDDLVLLPEFNEEEVASLFD